MKTTQTFALVALLSAGLACASTTSADGTKFCTGSLKDCVNQKVRVSARMAENEEIRQHGITYVEGKREMNYIMLGEQQLLVYSATPMECRPGSPTTVEGTLLAVSGHDHLKSYSGLHIAADRWTCDLL